MEHIYNVKTNFTFVEFQVIANSDHDAVLAAETVLNNLVLRDVEQREEITYLEEV